jgi:hypothetical protein
VEAQLGRSISYPGVTKIFISGLNNSGLL